ncbi:SRPBCC family protein [Echinicola jeungdonensis]|uniref:SRPBCC family protein n=1 Tax=Echinicola jeungdonensis TaxID=709343 RepID=A0ABV5J748_9BACT|nr:SRPBCC family protein [Echinicola jeungdonensis]MDN3669181.1 SRPBCC family protein [Echinicola jeungdonensis]
MKTTNKPIITISAVIASPVEKVWELYNGPAHITQWNFAIPEWHCPKAENDLRIGGKLCSRMEAKDGSFGFDFEATYDEVIPHQKIVYTLTDGRKVMINFDELEGKTKITTQFQAELENPIEMQRDGWQAILNNFKNYAETKS